MCEALIVECLLCSRHPYVYREPGAAQQGSNTTQHLLPDIPLCSQATRRDLPSEEDLPPTHRLSQTVHGAQELSSMVERLRGPQGWAELESPPEIRQLVTWNKSQSSRPTG